MIVGNIHPGARELFLVQDQEIPPLFPVQDHPDQRGVAVRVTPAGSGSYTVVREGVSDPNPTFSTVTV